MDALARMIDANANRAREGLRTMEDVARFRLGQQSLCGAIKQVRHELREVLAGLPGGQAWLVASRDTPGDVGIENKAEREGVRAGMAGIAAAAGKRAGEALRVIEECLKTPGLALAGPESKLWRRVEGLRYRVYELERKLVLALGTGRGVQWRLCVLITESLCKRSWREVAEQAIEGGADCLQLREPSESDGQLLAKARMLRALVEGRGVSVIVNNRVDVALLAGADGVHLGTGDLPIEAARELCGDRLLVGASTHNLAEARSAVAAGADYCGVGAMFVSTTKVRDISGPEYLRDYLHDEQLSLVPHLAIGGITVSNVGELTRIGGRGIAVSSVVCGAEDPARACAELLRGMAANAPITA